VKQQKVCYPTFICRVEESISLWSTWISACFALVFTAVVTNLLKWNPALIKSGSLARESATHEDVCGGVPTLCSVDSPLPGAPPAAPNPCGCGLGGADFHLADLAGLVELLAPLELGGFSVLGASAAARKLIAFAFSGESLTPQRSCGSCTTGTSSAVFKLGIFIAFAQIFYRGVCLNILWCFVQDIG
jgi:hypothetical protein